MENLNNLTNTLKVRVANFIPESVVDGSGIRFVVFTQGCPHKCEGCHNPTTHDFNGGEDFPVEEIYNLIKTYPLVKGVTFSGGEPFAQTKELVALAKLLKEDGYHLISYTGYTFEELINRDDPYTHQLLQLLDVLIDGPFILSQKNLLLKFRGSENQRILLSKESYKSKLPIETDI